MDALANAAGFFKLAERNTQWTSERTTKWTNTLLVIALGWALAVVSMKLLPMPDINYRTDVSTTAMVNTGVKADPLEQAQITAGLHLFGVFSDGPPPSTPPCHPDCAPPPDTRLNLKLAGVFAYTPTAKAIAIIGEGNNDQIAFGIGDKIVDGVTLLEVYRDYVVIDNRGTLEKLSLSEEIKPIVTRPIAKANENQSQGQQSQIGSIALPTGAKELRDHFVTQPAHLARVVAAQPYQENGKLVGYKITPKQNPEILEAHGVISGDVITSVNGIKLNSQKQGMRAIRSAIKAPALDVMILRDGVEIPISISFAQ